MSRDDFTGGFLQRLHAVRQKVERLRVARQVLQVYGEHPSREAEVAEAHTNLAAAELELAEFVYDALEANAAVGACR